MSVTKREHAGSSCKGFTGFIYISLILKFAKSLILKNIQVIR